MCFLSFYIIFNVQYIPLLAAIGHIMSKEFHDKQWWQAGRQVDSWTSKIDLIYLKFQVDPFLTPRCLSTPWIIPSTTLGTPSLESTATQLILTGVQLDKFVTSRSPVKFLTYNVKNKTLIISKYCTKKYLDFLLIYTLYTNHRTQKQNELNVVYFANFVKKAHFLFLASS